MVLDVENINASAIQENQRKHMDLAILTPNLISEQERSDNNASQIKFSNILVQILPFKRSMDLLQ